MSNKKNSFSAKGYYIALVLCAVAIGVSGYLYYRGGSEKTTQIPAAATLQTEPQLPAAQAGPGKVQQATEPAEETVAPDKTLKTAAPLEGVTVAPYSMEALSYNETTRDWRVHAGCDLAAEAGTEVKAAADGQVYTVYEDEGMGTTVVIRHDGGYTTYYASLAQDVAVQAGDAVTLGQTIGTVGSTALMESALGDHVCFQVKHNGETMDPAEFLN